MSIFVFAAKRVTAGHIIIIYRLAWFLPWPISEYTKDRQQQAPRWPQPPYLVEVVKLDLSYSSTHAWSDGFAGIPDEIRHRKQFGSCCVTLVAHLKMPADNEYQVNHMCRPHPSNHHLKPIVFSSPNNCMCVWGSGVGIKGERERQRTSGLKQSVRFFFF